MIILSGGRRSGKTTELVNMAKKDKFIKIVVSSIAKERDVYCSYPFLLENKQVITWTDFKALKNVKNKFLIDDFEECVKNEFIFKNVEAMSILNDSEIMFKKME